MYYFDMGNIGIQQMQLCICIASYGSFTKAAEAMHMTQPALSRKISALETQLGIVLFLRGNKVAARPTPAGKLLFEEWEKILFNLENSIIRAHEVQSCNNSNMLRITTIPTCAADRFLMPLVHSFTETHPDVEVRIEFIGITLQYKSLMEGKSAAAFVGTYKENLFGGDDIECTTVITAPWVVGMLPSNPLAKRESITVADLHNQRFIIPSSQIHPEFFEMLKGLCAANGFTPMIAYQTKNFIGVSMNVNRNDEVFIVNKFMQECYNPNFRYFDLSGSEGGIMMATKRHSGNPLVREFKMAANRYFQEMAQAAGNSSF